MYPENQAAGIAANRYGELMCQAAEDLGYDNDICGYARISLAYAAGCLLYTSCAGSFYFRSESEKESLHYLGKRRRDTPVYPAYASQRLSLIHI